MRYELWRYHRLLGVFTEAELKAYLKWHMDATIEERAKLVSLPVMGDEVFSIEWMLSCNEWAYIKPRRINDDAFGRMN